MKKNKINRICESNRNAYGTLMKIVEYNSNKDIIVEFQDEYKEKIHTTYQNFKNGKVKNPYDREVFGVGYYGLGKYKSRGKDGKQTKVYKTWQNMLKRCYDPYYINKEPTYIDCYVCDEWLNFQNFADWYYKNVYNCNNERLCLDKDILCKGNKMYSPETCVLVPEKINLLFTKRQSCRGKYPIGVILSKATPKNRRSCDVLAAGCNTTDENGKVKKIHLGYFPLNRPFQAFTAYKQFKENYIKQMADEYKNLIPQKLYDAMYAYEVEIND